MAPFCVGFCSTESCLTQSLPGQEEDRVVQQCQSVRETGVVGGYWVWLHVTSSVPEVDHAQQTSVDVAQDYAVENERADSQDDLAQCA